MGFTAVNIKKSSAALPSNTSQKTALTSTSTPTLLKKSLPTSTSTSINESSSEIYQPNSNSEHPKSLKKLSQSLPQIASTNSTYPQASESSPHLNTHADSFSETPSSFNLSSKKYKHSKTLLLNDETPSKVVPASFSSQLFTPVPSPTLSHSSSNTPLISHGTRLKQRIPINQPQKSSTLTKSLNLSTPSKAHPSLNSISRSNYIPETRNSKSPHNSNGLNSKADLIGQAQTQQAIHTHYIYPQLRSRANPPLDLNSVKRKNDIIEPSSKVNRLFGLEEVPVFRPTKDEFSDPMNYLSKIAQIGKSYGSVKIIPPENWNPEFSLDTEVCFS